MAVQAMTEKEKSLLDEFERMLSEEPPEIPKPDPNKCDHEWKEVPGFNYHTKYTVCKKCKVDKEHWEKDRKSRGLKWY